MLDKEIKRIISQLEKNELSITEVPDELKLNKDILIAERKLGLRREGNRGYDAIHGYFFVEVELVCYDDLDEPDTCSNTITFETIEEYFNYLDGDIYERACYKFCDLGKFGTFLGDNNIDIERLKKRETFLNNTIDSFVFEPSEEELDEYEECERNKKLIKNWIKKFNICKLGKELLDTEDKFRKSKLYYFIDMDFFIFCYIFQDINSEERFNAIMEYVCTGVSNHDMIVRALCSIYGAKRVLEKYAYSYGTKQTRDKHKRRLKQYINILTMDKIHFEERNYFDNNTHYYCKEVNGYEDGSKFPAVTYQRYFETFEEFISFNQGSLRNTDISGAIKLNIDFSIYEADDTTKLPILSSDNLISELSKHYIDGEFKVCKEWKTAEGQQVKIDTFTTRYFFDFVYFLQGDLSNSFLLYCDGLENIHDYEQINFAGSKMKSNLCEKFGVIYDKVELKTSLIESFDIIKNNEEESTNLLAEDCSMHSLMLDEGDKSKNQRISYITDIHLMHRLQNAKCKSKEDAQYVIQKIVDTIISESESILLIGGDISSDYWIFEVFVELLREGIDRRGLRKIDIIFTLGNHELWGFPGKSVEEIVSIYRKVIESNGMHLLHNELIYKNSEGEFCTISYDRINSLTIDELKEELLRTRLVFFGGLGFSGYNKNFNAEQGIYRDILNRNEEISESIKLEKLYNRVVPAMIDKNTIILTHTPKKDWSLDLSLQDNFVYISGHTHRNEFYDDGVYRCYKDNQIGYSNNNPHLKSFSINCEYDCFENYDDGIYEITRSQYQDFYRGKNIEMSFEREIYKLYMLKKNDYYCFIHKAQSGSLTILNGGVMKGLKRKDIEYYYANMDKMVSHIREPLDKYMSVMNVISQEVRKIGGSGTIHVCIVDIDWENHIYVNPIDLTISGYFAWDMVNKLVYPNLPALLEANCPKIYENYLKLIGEDKSNTLVPIERKDEVDCIPVEYLSTDIYGASREIRKMQRLYSNIISFWHEMGDLRGEELIDTKKGNSIDM